MSNLLEFRDKMDMYDKESLKIFARDLYIGKTSQLKKADLIEKIAENFLSKESLFNRLAILDEASLLLLEKAYGKVIEVKPDEPVFDMACTLNEMELAYFDEDHYFSTLTDVWEIYTKEIAGEEFNKYRARAAWVWMCLRWAETMYAYTPVDVFLKVVNKKKGMHMDAEELDVIYKRIPDDLLKSVKIENVLIERLFIGHMDSLDRLRRAQADKDYYFPTPAEVEELFFTGALLSHKVYKDMLAFLVKDMKMERDDAIDLLYELWDRISWQDDNPHDTMQWFWDQFEFANDQQVNKIVSLYMPLTNGTNMLINRGYAPSDMPRPVLKPGQMPTIIPGSSHAAKMLAEAAPHIREMGFGVDVDGESIEMPVMNMPMGMNGPVEKTTKKVYPNDPCPCGSGKKFKKCCGRN